MAGPSPSVVVSDSGGAYQSTPNGVNVGAGDAISVQLANAAGVSTWTLACVGTDDLSTAPTISVFGTGNNTRGFTAGGLGTAFLFQSTVTDFQDPPQQYIATFEVFVLAANGNRVIATNERFEGNAVYGWITKLNGYLRSANIGVYGEIYAVAADTVSLSLVAAGTPVQASLPHPSTTALNTAANGSPPTGVKVIIGGPVIVSAVASVVAPSGPTDVVFQLYQNSTPLPDAIVQVKMTAAANIAVAVESLVTAAANDIFSLYAYTSGAGGTVTLSITNAVLTVVNAGSNQGPQGPMGPPGLPGSAPTPYYVNYGGTGGRYASGFSVPNGNAAVIVDLSSCPTNPPQPLVIYVGVPSEQTKITCTLDGQVADSSANLLIISSTDGGASSVNNIFDAAQSPPQTTTTVLSGPVGTKRELTGQALSNGGLGGWFTG